MTLLKKSVLLLKVQKGFGEKDHYEELLKSHNFKVIQVNTLVFVYHDLTLLRKNVNNSDNFSGILLSSPRCVEAVRLALDSKYLDETWKNKHNYAVGEATHLLALDKLGIDCRGKESGNAKNLAELIVSENNGCTKPFLFPHGNLKTDTLKLELGKSNISIESVLVYDTLANPDIEDDLKNATKEYSEFPEYVVFFSPSGVRSSIEIIRKNIACLDEIKFIAIGPVTELTMKEENLNISGVAASPNPKEVLNLIVQ